MAGVPLTNPQPDFDALEQVIKGEREPEQVYFVELGIDGEMVEHLTERYIGKQWVPYTEETAEEYHRQFVDVYYRMGYDCLPAWPGFENMPQFKERRAADTAGLSRGERSWVEEGGGIIKNWDDFEQIGWEDITHDLSHLEWVTDNLPDGMKATVGTTVFEMILERFLGYQDLFILSHDNPELVDAVFEHWGQKVYDAYEQAIDNPKVGAIFHADDLGFKTATLVSPEFLRRNFLPWLKKYTSLAHEHGKTLWYHCCGDCENVMDDLIDDVGIDAFHSFEDVIMPIGDFMEKHPQIASLGGIDMDKLGRYTEEDLREYVRATLDRCMPGRFALGSGNTVANYIPPQNYIAMLEEGLKWSQ